MKELQKILEELIGSKPEQLTGEAKRLFEAIMKIADERDELLKERQADKEKIKEYSELLIKVNVQNLNNSIEQRKESNEQLEALHEGWKIELEKKDNRIKELEYERQADKEKIKELKKFCKSKSTFQTFGDTELQKILETYINRLKHRILDILEE